MNREETTYPSRTSLTRRFLLVLTALSVFFSGGPARAAFEDLGVGARATGMAEAFVGIADDADAIYYNPAGLAGLSRANLSTQFGQYLNNGGGDLSIGNTYLGFAQPIKEGERGTFGAAFNQFKVSGLYQERTVYLGYANRFKTMPLAWPGTLSWGFNLKQLHREFGQDAFSGSALNSAGLSSGRQDPLFANNGRTSTKYALDGGLLYKLDESSPFSFGLSVMNINRPDVSLGGTDDKVPQVLRFGGGYKTSWGVLGAELRRGKRLSSQTDTDIAIGGEYNLSRLAGGGLTARGGYARGSRDFDNVTLGLAYAFGDARIDYAFNLPLGGLNETKGSHRLGLSILIGGTPAPAAAIPVPTAAPRPAAAPSRQITTPSPLAPAKPAIDPAGKPALPLDPVDIELERSWDYYQQAVARGISDQRRMEILQSIVIGFGEKGAMKVSAELAEIRRRLGK